MPEIPRCVKFPKRPCSANCPVKPFIEQKNLMTSTLGRLRHQDPETVKMAENNINGETRIINNMAPYCALLPKSK
jgi:hypothetical protein